MKIIVVHSNKVINTILKEFTNLTEPPRYGSAEYHPNPFSIISSNNNTPLITMKTVYI
jgi:hypothetical protein